MKNQTLTNDEVHALLQGIYITKDKEGLWEFIKDFFGVEIPRKKVCRDHTAPFDFVCEVFFQEEKNIIAIANRSGGKTLNFSILDALNSYLHDGCETATIGAIESQAQKCYKYLVGWINRIHIFKEKVTATLRSMTEWVNGSSVQILIATMRGVNAPHPQKVFLDEFELMTWPVIQEAFSMAQSKGDIRGQTIITSSRKFAFGPMERILEEAEERGYKVYKWCILETIEKHDPKVCANSIFHEDCKGRCLEYEGFYKLEDAISAKRQLDLDVWLSQWLSQKPMQTDLVYPQFNPAFNVKSLKVDTGAELYLSEDFGFAAGHANVVGFWQTFGGKKKLIDEIWIEGKADDEIIDLVEEKIVELGFIIKRYADLNERDIYRSHYNKVVKAWFCPVEEPSKIMLRQRKGYRVVVQRDAEMRKVITGIPLVRKDLREEMLEIDPRCKGTISEMGKYPNKKRGDGTVLDEPDKKFDNGPDMIRYFYINMFPPKNAGHFEEDRVGRSESQPITSGIRDALF